MATRNTAAQRMDALEAKFSTVLDMLERLASEDALARAAGLPARPASKTTPVILVDAPVGTRMQATRAAHALAHTPGLSCADVSHGPIGFISAKTVCPRCKNPIAAA